MLLHGNLDNMKVEAAQPYQFGSTSWSSAVEGVTPPHHYPEQNQFTHTLHDHINALKHLDDEQILQLLSAARNGGQSPSISSPRLSIASSPPSTPAAKNFACTFCDKRLKSKPYWKSHEEEFHEQKFSWCCPDCGQVFYAGKRFREHHTKLHHCNYCKQPSRGTRWKQSPCVKKHEKVKHTKDAWGCGFCASLLTTWEERCDHIAIHFEEKDPSKWNFTNVILGLLKQPQLYSAWNQMMARKYGDEQQWPSLAWEFKKCSRLRYELEIQWDAHAVNIEELVQETFDLAEIDVKSANEATPGIFERSDSGHAELVDVKLGPYGIISDIADEGQQSSHVLVQDPMIFSAGTMPVLSDLSHYTAYMVYGCEENQQDWSNTGFASTPDPLQQQLGSHMYCQQPMGPLSAQASQHKSFPYHPRQNRLPLPFHQQLCNIDNYRR